MTRLDGAIVSLPLRTTGSRTSLRLHPGGEGAMASLTLIAVGFLVALAVVIALARGSTARWERAKRASVARRVDVPPRAASDGSAVLPRSPVVRRGLAVLSGRASRLARIIRQRPWGHRQIRRLGAFSPFGNELRTTRWRKGRPSAAESRGDGCAADAIPEPRRAPPARAPRRALAFLQGQEERPRITTGRSGRRSRP